MIRTWLGSGVRKPILLEVDFGNSNLESQTYPMPMHWSDKTSTYLTLQMNKESAFLNLKRHLRKKNFWGIFLWDKNFQGDRGHFLWLTPHWESLEDCLACADYRKLRRVILGPRSILIVYCLNTVCTLYSFVVTACACDYRYGLISSLNVFLHLKIDYACMLSGKKLNPRHLFSCIYFWEGLAQC